jgi:hypothetical protein
MSASYDNVKHRSQGIDATLSNNEQIIRTTDITAKPRSYVGELRSRTGKGMPLHTKKSRHKSTRQKGYALALQLEKQI